MKKAMPAEPGLVSWLVARSSMCSRNSWFSCVLSHSSLSLTSLPIITSTSLWSYPSFFRSSSSSAFSSSGSVSISIRSR